MFAPVTRNENGKSLSTNENAPAMPLLLINLLIPYFQRLIKLIDFSASFRILSIYQISAQVLFYLRCD